MSPPARAAALSADDIEAVIGGLQMIAGWLDDASPAARGELHACLRGLGARLQAEDLPVQIAWFTALLRNRQIQGRNPMTGTRDTPLELPAGQAQHILGLLGITEALLSALRARGERGERQMLASLEELAALLTGGGDAGQLTGQLDAAQRALAGLMLARSAQ
ncbi:MAG: hypothetical protein ACLQDY_28745 [Streptosporangiaceae bacterium]